MGFPLLKAEACAATCGACERICPTGALSSPSASSRSGQVRFLRAVRKGLFRGRHPFLRRTSFSFVPERGTDRRRRTNARRIRRDRRRGPVRKSSGFSAVPLKLRQVSAGGCNACEAELAACGNVNFDMGRFGIEFTASPRHADGIVLDGPYHEKHGPGAQGHLPQHRRSENSHRGGDLRH